jgi:hypothetical protein
MNTAAQNTSRRGAWRLATWIICLLFAPAMAAAEDDGLGLSEAELDQLLAPIALYPDALLSQVLMAATYPLEIVAAARWSQANPDLDGTDAVDAVADRNWDPSVKTMVAFPDLLARMNDELEWTKSLGDAFLYQEADVMAAVQRLRAKADAAGSLEKLEHVVVEREKEIIIIRQAAPEYIYVPYYSTHVVYGDWWWPGYPPVYWGWPGIGFSTSIGFYWGRRVHVSTGFFYGHCDWRHRHIIVAPVYRHPRVWYGPSVVYQRSDYTRWRHDPRHRRGVGYVHPTLNREYGRYASSNTYNRRDVGQLPRVPRARVDGVPDRRPPRVTGDGSTRPPRTEGAPTGRPPRVTGDGSTRPPRTEGAPTGRPPRVTGDGSTRPPRTEARPPRTETRTPRGDAESPRTRSSGESRGGERATPPSTAPERSPAPNPPQTTAPAQRQDSAAARPPRAPDSSRTVRVPATATNTPDQGSHSDGSRNWSSSHTRSDRGASTRDSSTMRQMRAESSADRSRPLR